MSEAQPLARAARAWPWVWLILLAAGIAVRVAEPITYIFLSPEDDQLMVRMAHGFLQGHWSTPWSVTGVSTLVKPVGYPIFLAAAHFLPWSPSTTTYLLYLAGAVLVASGWLRLTRKPWQSTVILAALVFQPVLFSIQSQRIYRDSYVEALATLAVGLAFQLVPVSALREGSVKSSHSHRRKRPALASRQARLAARVVGAGLVGVLVGCIVITKPTWFWVVPAVLAPLAYPAARLLASRAGRGRAVAVLALLGVAVSAGAGFVVETVRIMNRRTYGVTLVEDFSAGGLSIAWKRWASVEAGPRRPYEPITTAMRAAVFAVSPTAHLLEPYLDSPSDPWHLIHCAGVAKPCEGSGKYFEWDLRFAAAATGRVHSARQLQDFFYQVADQISRACAAGRLRCTSSPVLATGLPPLEDISLTAAAGDTAAGLWRMVLARYSFVPPAAADPSRTVYDEWTSVVPGIPPRASLSAPQQGPWLYGLLGRIDSAYSDLNLLALGLLLLGGAIALYRVIRRSSSLPGEARYAYTAAALFLVSGVVGMGTLGVFDAAQSPTYVDPLYWSDFATPVELVVAFGLVAGVVSVPRLRRVSLLPPANEAGGQPGALLAGYEPGG